MALGTLTATALAGASPVDEEIWCAVYTQSRQEKKVESRLLAKGVETFLPLYESLRRWNTRRVTVRLPLFPGYLFVKIHWGDRVKVLQTSGVAAFVRFDAGPARIPESQIEAVRRCLGADYTVKPCRFVSVGSRARILSGPLQGVEGIVRRSKSQTRFVISVELIQRSMLVEVDSTALEALPSKKAHGRDSSPRVEHRVAS